MRSPRKSRLIIEPSDLLGALVLGAGLVYWLDPVAGSRRRAIIRDKAHRTAREMEEAARIGGRDLAHRAEGIAAKGRGLVRRSPEADPRKLEARVRTELGRVCSHPGAIEVSVDGRCVALGGPVLAEERDEIVQRITRVRGVEEVESELEPHETAEGVPALQGASRPRRGRAVVPATKLLLGGASLAFGAAALARLRVLGFALGGLGALWAARSIRERGALEGRLRPRRLLQEASERASEARSGRLGASA